MIVDWKLVINWHLWRNGRYVFYSQILPLFCDFFDISTFSRANPTVRWLDGSHDWIRNLWDSDRTVARSSYLYCCVKYSLCLWIRWCCHTYVTAAQCTATVSVLRPWSDFRKSWISPLVWCRVDESSSTYQTFWLNWSECRCSCCQLQHTVCHTQNSCNGRTRVYSSGFDVQ